MNVHTPQTIGFTRNFSFGIPFWTIAEHGARERARELGVTLAMRHCTTAAEMAASIQNLIQQRVDAILVAAIDPNFPSFLSALAQATAAGIPIIAVDVSLPFPVASLVCSDDRRGAASCARYLAEHI